MEGTKHCSPKCPHPSPCSQPHSFSAPLPKDVSPSPAPTPNKMAIVSTLLRAPQTWGGLVTQCQELKRGAEGPGFCPASASASHSLCDLGQGLSCRMGLISSLELSCPWLKIAVRVKMVILLELFSA
uniref:Uncharacterized protein n=1 Tax=Chelonoidis abingdonii TaxID=106734 RepID=A0A8C0HFE9_CHEAB